MKQLLFIKNNYYSLNTLYNSFWVFSSIKLFSINFFVKTIVCTQLLMRASFGQIAHLFPYDLADE